MGLPGSGAQQRRTGNGLYKITLQKGASGLTDGEDPWDGNRAMPVFLGASLVIVGTGSNYVGLLDEQAGTTFGPTTYSNYYELPITVSSSSQVLLDNFGYDGQLGFSRTGSSSQEQSYALGWPSQANNILFSGQGSAESSNSDWDGSSGGRCRNCGTTPAMTSATRLSQETIGR